MPKKLRMTAKQARRILKACAAETFDYFFRHVESCSEVKDSKFHALRLAYIHAADALEDYLKKAGPAN